MTCWGPGWYTIGGGENFHHEHPDNYWKIPAHEVSRFCGFLHIYSYMQSLYTQMLGCYSVLARRNIIWVVDIEILFTLFRNYSSNSVWIASLKTHIFVVINEMVLNWMLYMCLILCHGTIFDSYPMISLKKDQAH